MSINIRRCDRVSPINSKTGRISATSRVRRGTIFTGAGGGKWPLLGAGMSGVERGKGEDGGAGSSEVRGRNVKRQAPHVRSQLTASIPLYWPLRASVIVPLTKAIS